MTAVTSGETQQIETDAILLATGAHPRISPDAAQPTASGS